MIDEAKACLSGVVFRLSQVHLHSNYGDVAGSAPKTPPIAVNICTHIR